MAVAFDAKSVTPTQFNNNFTSPQTDTTLTIGASATLLIVEVAFGSGSGAFPTITGVTWNGVSMTQLSTKTSSDGFQIVYVFGLINPATGNKTLSMSFTGSTANCSGGIGTVSFSGTDTTGLTTCVPSANIITDASLSTAGGLYPSTAFAVTTATGDAAYSVMNISNTDFPSMAAGTLLADLSNFHANASHGYALASGASTNLQFSGGGGANQACGIALRIVQASGTVSLPFNQTDFPPVHDLLGGPAFQQAYNQSLYPNPIPTLNIDSAKPIRLKGSYWEQPYNPNLYTVTVTTLPFTQGNLPPPVPFRSSPVDFYNLVLFAISPIPFNQTDWATPIRQRPLPNPDQSLNINLLTNPIPFNQIDWSKPFRVQQARLEPNQALNINLFTNPIPFNQYDWAKPVRVPLALPQPAIGINPNIFTNPIPFVNIDTSRLSFLRSSLLVDQPYNLCLYGIIIAPYPFNQYDFSVAFRKTPVPSQDRQFNPNLFTNPVPFNQFDYPPPHRVQQALRDLSTSLDPNRFQSNPVPFYNVDYTPQKKPVPVPLDTSQGFQLLYQPFVPPTPTAASYRLLVDHYIRNTYLLAYSVVTEGIEVPLGWVPTMASEPLNAAAIQAYWNAGPPAYGENVDYYNAPFIVSPTTRIQVFWKQIAGTKGYFQLTGAGAALGPKRNG